MRMSVFQEIMEQAISELREALGEEPEGGEAEGWDPDAWEEEVRQFTQQLGQRMMQVWGEVRTEQAQARAPFVPAAGEDATYTDGNPSGG